MLTQKKRRAPEPALSFVEGSRAFRDLGFHSRLRAGFRYSAQRPQTIIRHISNVAAITGIHFQTGENEELMRLAGVTR